MKIYPDTDTCDDPGCACHGEMVPDFAPPDYTNVLQRADELTSRERNEVYGPPSEDFGRTAGMISSMLSHKLSEPLTAQDFAAIMVCCKLSRLMKTPGHWDSIVDIAGYARTMEMLDEEVN